LELELPEEPTYAEASHLTSLEVTTNVGDLRAQAELGLWLSGLESFLGTTAHPFADKLNVHMQDWSAELRLALAGMQVSLAILSQPGLSTTDNAGGGSLSRNDRDMLGEVLRDGVVLGEALLNAGPVDWAGWSSWSRMVVANLHQLSAFERVASFSENAVDDAVPSALWDLVKGKSVAFSDRLDLINVVRGFARILKRLSIVEKMLRSDAPPKPALLIFARLHEDTQELVNYINHRLSRFPDEDAELFRTLDTASYTASIELRKVFDQELAGLPTVRSAATVYARIETAYSILRDAIQQILVGIACMISPDVRPADIFPQLKQKVEQSIFLRKELAAMLKAVRSAEQDAASKDLTTERLREFVEGPVQSLFYKDRESVERFVEEVLRTPDRKDLVPILHRFGAYLETIFGHVCNRTVLADHPFNES
jgi:hypothetical protein